MELFLYRRVLARLPQERGSGDGDTEIENNGELAVAEKIDLKKMNLEQKITWNWWTKSAGYFVYFLRETTGIVIGFYGAYFLIETVISKGNPSFIYGDLFTALSVVALAAALFHSFTWIWLTAKLITANLNKIWEIFLFGFLTALFFILSYFVLIKLYE